MGEFHAGDCLVRESTTWENISQSSKGIRKPKLRTHDGHVLADEYTRGAKDRDHEMIRIDVARPDFLIILSRPRFQESGAQHPGLFGIDRMKVTLNGLIEGMPRNRGLIDWIK
jgi:hypothetical protein